jgi:hypothetical protein
LISAIPIIIALLLQLNSQPPSPTPPKVAQPQQQQGANKTSEGERPQLTNPETTGIVNNKSDNHTSEGNEKTPTNRWFIGLTGALVLLAGAQFWAMHRQAEYMRKGLSLSIRQARTAARSADAAVLSAETAKQALALLEVADIMVSEISFSTGGLMARETVLCFLIKNCGRSRAENVTVVGEFCVSAATVPLTTLPIACVLGAGDTLELRSH